MFPYVILFSASYQRIQSSSAFYLGPVVLISLGVPVCHTDLHLRLWTWPCLYLEKYYFYAVNNKIIHYFSFPMFCLHFDDYMNQISLFG